MRRRSLLGVPLVLVLVACQSGPPVAPTAQRVVMVSYDGVGADLAWQWIEQGAAASGLAPMAEHGLSARGLRPQDPTLTSVNHACLITGRQPAHTGIVSNVFRAPGSPITEVVSGFSAAIEAPTLVQAVQRQGGRVGALLWPGVDGRGPDRSGDFGLRWPTTPLADSAIVELEAAAARSGSQAPSQDGAAGLEWDLPVPVVDGGEPASVTWTVALVDGTPDRVERLDTVAVRGPGDDAWQFVLDLEWFPLQVRARGPEDVGPARYGSWCKVLRVDRHGRSLRLYRGAFYRLLAYPETFAREVEERVGFWPGPPDDRLVADWWIDVGTGLDLDSYLEQVERFDRYLDAVAEHVLATEPFSLLLAYHPTPDEFQHSSLIVDRRQWPYSPGSAVAAREGLRRVGRSVDASVAALWRGLDPQRDALVVVSDHGHVAYHDEVRLNRALADAGLVSLEEHAGRLRVAPSSRVVAVTSGGSAHVYLNLVGRDPGGVVDPADADEVLRQAARVLADLNVDGEPVVEQVLGREEAAAFGLGHPASGDLVVWLHPGFGASPSLSGPVVSPSRMYGGHGQLSHHARLHAMLFARGAGVPGGRREEMHVTEVAGLVAGLLGLSFP
jgi:predicted AlkP superfamily phosphohydrolase/phosphomutase